MLLFLIAALVFAVDQSAKHFAVLYLKHGSSVPVFGKCFYLTLVENTGIAFGILQEYAPALLLVITASVLALLVYSFFRHPDGHYKQVAYGFILGGALGNLTDRLRLGHVVDFLDFRIWPVFNFADTFITIGVGLFLLIAFKKEPHAS